MINWTTLNFQDYTIEGAGPGGGPHVIIKQNGRLIRSFFAFESTVRNGVRIAIVDGFLKIGAGPGGAPAVVTCEISTGREIKREFLGNPNDRYGSLGFGRIPIFVGRDIIQSLYGYLKQLETVVHLTTLMPSMYPSEFLTIMETDLSFVGLPINGYCSAVWNRRQPMSMNMNLVLVDRSLDPGYKAVVVAHETGHFFTLGHGATGLMASPAQRGTFTQAEVDIILKVAK